MDNLSQQIFDKWRYNVSKEGQESRYSHNNRSDFLEELVGDFKNYGIPYEKASEYLNQVVLTLTTREGRKGKGRYKGWKEMVENDFKGVIANFYLENIPKPTNLEKIPSNKTHDKNTIPRDRWVENWCFSKFGESVSQKMINEAHRIGSSLNLQFLKDTFNGI